MSVNDVRGQEASDTTDEPLLLQCPECGSRIRQFTSREPGVHVASCGCTVSQHTVNDLLTS